MNEYNKKMIEKGYGTVRLSLHTDERGSLSFAEWKHLPFEPKRIFWIFDIQEGKTRGGHAHRSCAEVVFAVSGSFDMFVDNGREQTTIHIANPNEGIYIGANVWCELRNFAPNTVCIAVASAPYDKNGYINNYNEYKEIQR